MKANKIPIEEGKASGGLFDLEQLYKINYLEREENYTDKIELAILLKKKDGTEGAYRSLRFSSENELKIFVKKLCKAYIYFSLKRVNKELINDELKLNYLANLLHEIDKEINNMYSEDEM